MNYNEERSRNNEMSKELYKACPEIMDSFMNVHAEYSKESTITFK